jgi:hypothetical protein
VNGLTCSHEFHDGTYASDLQRAAEAGAGLGDPIDEHDRNDSEHTFAFKGVCKIGTQLEHFGHRFQMFDDPAMCARGAGQPKQPDHTHQDQGAIENPAQADATGPSKSSSRDPQQRWRRLRGITTTRSNHAKAGKQVNRVSPHAQLRSLTLNGARTTSSRSHARPTSSLNSARLHGTDLG